MALAFFESDVPTLIAATQSHFSPGAPVNQIVDNVTTWRRQHPTNWRATRRLIKDHLQ